MHGSLTDEAVALATFLFGRRVKLASSSANQLATPPLKDQMPIPASQNRFESPTRLPPRDNRKELMFLGRYMGLEDGGVKRKTREKTGLRRD